MVSNRNRLSGLFDSATSVDGPDSFDLLAAGDEDAVVKIDGGVAVGDDEFEAVAKLDSAAFAFESERTVFIAGEGVSDARNAFDDGGEGAVGGGGFDAGVEDGGVGVRLGADGREDGEGVGEIVVDGAGGAPDAVVVEVHEEIRAGLEFGDAVDVGIDVVGSGGGSGEPGAGDAFGFEGTAGGDGGEHGFAVNGDAGIEADDVGGVAGISLEAFEGEVREFIDVFGEGDSGGSGGDAGAEGDVEIEGDGEG